MSGDDTNNAVGMLLGELRARQQEQDETMRELSAVLAQTLEILYHRDDLKPGHKRLFKKLASSARKPLTPEVQLSTITDKYAVEGPDIDCASRLHLCKARCCSFKVKLSEQDIREGELEWELKNPYMLVRGEDGYCTYMARDGGGCTRYHQRPGICRIYDCREDSRIWLDFEKRVPAPVK
ncbi:MAG: YkgJ family cysteine cluster protein [Myxococcota bacterium]